MFRVNDFTFKTDIKDLGQMEYVVCKCKCGNTKKVQVRRLRAKSVKSCGKGPCHPKHKNFKE